MTEQTAIPFPIQEKPHEAFQVHKILDHGFVRLIDCMPSPTDPYSIPADAAIVQAARVSYGKGTKAVNEDKGLINYLMRHRHTTPFEMVDFKFHARMPIFIARQWIRHRTASVNEYSARYSEVPDIFYMPELDSLKGQSTTNKQASDGSLDEGARRCMQTEIDSICDQAYKTYNGFLKDGLSRELARMVLPVNFYTEWYWKINLHNLLHFLGLRADPHAQMEIRVYADAMFEICRKIAPIATEAFETHRMKSVSISSDEFDIIQSIVNTEGLVDKLNVQFEKKGWSTRRRKEFMGSMNRILKDLRNE